MGGNTKDNRRLRVPKVIATLVLFAVLLGLTHIGAAILDFLKDGRVGHGGPTGIIIDALLGGVSAHWAVWLVHKRFGADGAKISSRAIVFATALVGAVVVIGQWNGFTPSWAPSLYAVSGWLIGSALAAQTSEDWLRRLTRHRRLRARRQKAKSA